MRGVEEVGCTGGGVGEGSLIGRESWLLFNCALFEESSPLFSDAGPELFVGRGEVSVTKTFSKI